MSAPAAVRALRGTRARRTREEARNGLPVEQDLTQPLPQRLLRTPLAWVSLVVVVGYVVCLVLLYRQVVPDQQVPGGVLPGLGREAIPIAAKYALITALPLSLLFLWADRYRPQRFWVWLMTFGWGACVATYVAAGVNTWAASHLSIIGDGDPATGARAAIFVAPFVEEASKATVLFWLAILMRYAWVSRLSGIVLAGLSGAAFAFVENILYYGRAYRYAARTIGSVSPEEALHQTFVVRGLFTFFGHPLFTSMTGIGLAVAMRSKSKTVRVVAPLAGFCCAALLHMSFNTAASLLSERQQILVLVFVAVPLVLGFVAFVVRQLFAQGRLIRTRLGDYVRVGWLEPDDPRPLSRLRTRLRALWHALFAGPAAFLATLRLQRAVTELAYLRDAMDRGLVDATGQRRERVLLARLKALRPLAVVEPVGRAAYPWQRLRRRGARYAAVPAYVPPAFPGPAGLGGSYPAPAASPGVPGPLGQTATRYSEVDPTWKPPGE
jgi:RsiW-degrading membrane proteinase PrsW (M82 family)